MTQPIAHDYPDWARQQSSSDIIVVDHSSQLINAALVDDIKFVGHYPYVHVEGINGATGVKTVLRWFADQAGATVIDIDSVDALVNVPYSQVVPVRGPFLQVETILNAYPNTFTTLITMMSEPANPFGGIYGDNALITQLNAGPLGGGANVTLTANSVRGGSAYFEADVLGATVFTIYLYAVDYQGVQNALASVYPASRGQPRNIHLPAQTIQVRVFNQDAAAHDYRVLLSHANFAI
jgi:hypothetical protein